MIPDGTTLPQNLICRSGRSPALPYPAHEQKQDYGTNYYDMCQGVGLAFRTVTVALFCRDGGLNSPCNWPFQPVICELGFSKQEGRPDMKTKRRVILIVLLSLILLIAAVAVWFFQFNPTGYRMTVSCRASFEKISDTVFVNRNYAGNRDDIAVLIDEAIARDTDFFGSLVCRDHTVIIICDDEKLLAKLGGDHDTQTVLFPVKRSYVSVSIEYLNVDVLAHELTHAELHERLSGKALRRIPTWFNEGIALQNDYRDQYSSETWEEQTDNGKHIVAHEDMDTGAEFYSGTKEDRRFRYLNAKHDVAEWMETHGLQGFMDLIDRLNDGEDFITVYSS